MDPITITIGAAFLAGGYALTRGPKQPNPKAPLDCGSTKSEQAAVGVAMAGIGGAQEGGQAGPVGAGVGAGLGVALATTSLLSGPCGAQWEKHWADQVAAMGQDVCDQADSAYARLKSAGGNIPGWDNLSCDQKNAAIAAVALSYPAAVMGTVYAGAASAWSAAGHGYDSLRNTWGNAYQTLPSAIRSPVDYLGAAGNSLTSAASNAVGTKATVSTSGGSVDVGPVHIGW